MVYRLIRKYSQRQNLLLTKSMNVDFFGVLGG